MIRDALLPALRLRFPDISFQIGDSPNPIAIFPAAHKEVGDVSIWDDGDEATVSIGEITHGHFNPYDETLTPEEIANRVTEEVVAFLKDLFADRVLLWKSLVGGAGGWSVLGHNNSLSLIDTDDLTYLWSGPVKNPEIGSAG